MVFCGTGAIVMNDVSGGSVTHIGISLTFGAAVMAMIVALGDSSGAHLNPAVSFAFFTSGNLPRRDLAPYIAAQCTGAVLASVMLKFLFPNHPTLGATLPSLELWKAFALEMLLTFFLMFVICRVAIVRSSAVGVVVGSVVAMEALFAGAMTGASMNPARSLAPALVSGDSDSLESLWIYLTAPPLGTWLGSRAALWFSPKTSF